VNALANMAFVHISVDARVVRINWNMMILGRKVFKIF